MNEATDKALDLIYGRWRSQILYAGVTARAARIVPEIPAALRSERSQRQQPVVFDGQTRSMLEIDQNPRPTQSRRLESPINIPDRGSAPSEAGSAATPRTRVNARILLRVW